MSETTWSREYAQRTKARLLPKGKKARQLAIEHYGGKCACCGETIFAFLTIDHINGDGWCHKPNPRAKTRLGGERLYKWLYKHGWPDGYRVLCLNCNVAMARLGQCPHGTLPPQATRLLSNPYCPARDEVREEVSGKIKEGLKKAKKRGVKLGRQEMDLSRNDIALDRIQGNSITSVARKYKTSRATVIRIARQYQEFMDNLPDPNRLIQIDPAIPL